MQGLPFGAAQSYSVASEFRSYEHIAGIEFIEIDPDKPYPRSVAYRATQDGAQMRIRDYAPNIDEFDLPLDEARALIESLSRAGLFEWQRVYRPAQGTFVVAALEWRVEVTFDVAIDGKRTNAFKVEGEAICPDNYEQVIAALMGARKADAE